MIIAIFERAHTGTSTRGTSGGRVASDGRTAARGRIIGCRSIIGGSQVVSGSQAASCGRRRNVACRSARVGRSLGDRCAVGSRGGHRITDKGCTAGIRGTGSSLWFN